MLKKLKSTKMILILVFWILSLINVNAQIQVGTGSTTCKSLPIEPYYGYSYSQQIYLATLNI